jgi:hypothetical protein
MSNTDEYCNDIDWENLPEEILNIVDGKSKPIINLDPQVVAVTETTMSNIEAQATIAANEEVTKAAEPTKRLKRKPQHYDPQQRYAIASYALEYGNAAAQKFFCSELGFEVPESTVRKFKKLLLAQRQIHAEEYRQPLVNLLPPQQVGRPLQLGKWDGLVVEYIKNIRSAGGIVNRNIVLGAALGIIKTYEPSLLRENGGSLALTPTWACSFLRRLRFVKRKGTKAAKKLPENFEVVKSNFISLVKQTVTYHSIPRELCVNVDETGALFIPVSNWTMEEEGAKQVPIAALDDKRQMTVVLGVSCAGELLPPQLLYAGKTAECHPKGILFPAQWDVNHTESHWSNERSLRDYVNTVLVPYFEHKKKKLGLPPTQKSLLIWDVYAPHRSQPTRDFLASNNICLVFVPACCTSELQPLDLTVNSVFKAKQRENFRHWYAQEVKKQLDKGVPVESMSINMPLSVVKPQHARWLISSCEFLKDKRELIVAGFQKAGILEGWGNCVESDLLFPPEVPFASSEEIEAAQVDIETENAYDSSDDDLTVAELLRKQNQI